MDGCCKWMTDYDILRSAMRNLKTRESFWAGSGVYSYKMELKHPPASDLFSLVKPTWCKKLSGKWCP